VDVLIAVSGEEAGVGAPRQRLRFHDDTSLYFDIAVDADLSPLKHSSTSKGTAVD